MPLPQGSPQADAQCGNGGRDAGCRPAVRVQETAGAIARLLVARLHRLSAQRPRQVIGKCIHAAVAMGGVVLQGGGKHGVQIVQQRAFAAQRGLCLRHITQPHRWLLNTPQGQQRRGGVVLPMRRVPAQQAVQHGSHGVNVGGHAHLAVCIQLFRCGIAQ